jgi:GntR family transcriptional repressor for pyruvate dehydrogenase complex
MFTEVNQKSIVEEVRAQFISLIAEGKLAPGDRLPGEQDLIQMFGVSRPALREALHRMIGEDLLEVRPGIGTFVREVTSANAIQGQVISLLLLKEDIREIQDVRRILETECIARAAIYATEEELNELKEIIANMEKAVRAGQGILLVVMEFHTHLVRLCRNPVMAKIANIVLDLTGLVQKPFYDNKLDLWNEVEEHKILLQAVLTRDPEQARSAMIKHLDNVNKYIDELYNRGSGINNSK